LLGLVAPHPLASEIANAPSNVRNLQFIVKSQYLYDSLTGDASLLLTRFMFPRVGRADQRIRAALNRCCEFLEVFRDMKQIIEEFIDVLGVHVEGLV
jgi:hypothetical protein